MQDRFIQEMSQVKKSVEIRRNKDKILYANVISRRSADEKITSVRI